MLRKNVIQEYIIHKVRQNQFDKKSKWLNTESHFFLPFDPILFCFFLFWNHRQVYRIVDRRWRPFMGRSVYDGMINARFTASTRLEMIIERKRKERPSRGRSLVVVVWSCKRHKYLQLDELYNSSSLWGSHFSARYILLPPTVLFFLLLSLFFTVLCFWHYVPSSSSKISLFQWLLQLS